VVSLFTFVVSTTTERLSFNKLYKKNLITGPDLTGNENDIEEHEVFHHEWNTLIGARQLYGDSNNPKDFLSEVQAFRSL
jgi:hypothetical protein